MVCFRFYWKAKQRSREKGQHSSSAPRFVWRATFLQSTSPGPASSATGTSSPPFELYAGVRHTVSRSCLCREILQPRDMVTIPADNNTYMHFCGQFCLSVFRHKKKQVDKAPDKTADKRLEKKPEKPPEKQLENQRICSICNASNKVRHQLLVL